MSKITGDIVLLRSLYKRSILEKANVQCIFADTVYV